VANADQTVRKEKKVSLERMEREMEGNDEGREMERTGKRRFRRDTCHMLHPVELKYSVEDDFRRDEHIRAASVFTTHQSHNERAHVQRSSEEFTVHCLQKPLNDHKRLYHTRIFRLGDSRY